MTRVSALCSEMIPCVVAEGISIRMVIKRPVEHEHLKDDPYFRPKGGEVHQKLWVSLTSFDAPTIFRNSSNCLTYLSWNQLGLPLSDVMALSTGWLVSVKFSESMHSRILLRKRLVISGLWNPKIISQPLSYSFWRSASIVSPNTSAYPCIVTWLPPKISNRYILIINL